MWGGNEVRPVLNRVLNLLDTSFGNGQVTMLGPVFAGTYLVLGQQEDGGAARVHVSVSFPVVY